MSPPVEFKETPRQVFLSHAHADKDDIVLPFTRELDKRRISYWIDEAEITWGKSITSTINAGLARADFVVIFLSDAFVGRNWPEAEMAAALSRENAEGRTVVLPIIVGESSKLLASYPLLRDKKFLDWDLGPAAIADELQKLVGRRWSKEELDRYIRDEVDLEHFSKEGWGADRLLARRMRFDEGVYFFWNDRDAKVEKYPVDSVRTYDSEPLTENDIQFIRSIVVDHPRRAKAVSDKNAASPPSDSSSKQDNNQGHLRRHKRQPAAPSAPAPLEKRLRLLEPLTVTFADGVRCKVEMSAAYQISQEGAPVLVATFGSHAQAEKYLRNQIEAAALAVLENLTSNEARRSRTSLQSAILASVRSQISEAGLLLHSVNLGEIREVG